MKRFYQFTLVPWLAAGLFVTASVAFAQPAQPIQPQQQTQPKAQPPASSQPSAAQPSAPGQVQPAQPAQATPAGQPAPAAAAAPATDSPDPYRFLPAAMDVAVKVDLVDLMQAIAPNPADKKALEDKFRALARKKAPETADIVDALGVHVSSDIRGFVAGAFIDPANPNDPMKLFALKSTISLDKLVGVVKQKEAGKVSVAPFNQDGVQGFVFSNPKSTSDKPVYLTSKGDVILVSPTAMGLKSALDANQSGKSAFVSGVAAQGLNLIDRTAQAIFVLNPAKMPKQSKQSMPGLDDVKLVAISLKFADQTFSAQVAAQFGDPKNAQMFAAQVMGIKSMFSANSKDPNMKALLDKLNIAAEGTTLRANVSLTRKEIDDLKAEMEKKPQNTMNPQNPPGAPNQMNPPQQGGQNPFAPKHP